MQTTGRPEQKSDAQRMRELEAELKLARERFNVIFQNTTVSIWDYIFETRQIVQPTRSQELHGFDTVVENVPESLIESGFVHPDSVQAFRALYNRVLAGEMHAEGVFRVQTADRTGYWYEHIRYNTLLDDQGRAYAAVGMSTDVTQEVANREAAENWRTMLTGALGVQGAVVEFDLSADALIAVEHAGPSTVALPHDCGYDAYIEAYTRNYVYLADIERVKKRLHRSRLLADYLDGKRELCMEYRMRDGEQLYWVRMNGRLMQREGGQNICLLMLHTDITDQKQRELQLQRLADTDDLSQLLNHRAFVEQAEEVLSQFPGQPHGLLVMDMDDFKLVNDTYGHSTGDRLLGHVGRCITEVLNRMGQPAVTARVGGDEFAVLFYGGERAMLEQCSSLLQERLSTPVMDGIWLSASMGAALYPQDGKSFSELYLAADRTLYHVKHHGKGICRFYDSIWREKNETLLRRQQFLSDTFAGGMMGGYIEEGFPIYFIDERMLHWLGYASEEAFAAANEGRILNCIHPEDQSYVKNALEQQLRYGDRYEIDHRIRKQDGSYLWIHNSGERMTAPDGRAAITAVCYDISVEKEHDGLIQSLVNDANGGIGLYRIEPDWRLTLLFASEGLGKLGNRSDGEYRELCRRDAMESVYEPDRESVLEMMRKAVEEDTVTSISYRVHQPGGGNSWITGTFSRLGTSQGRPVLRAVYLPLPLQYELQMQTLDTDFFGAYVIDKYTKEVYYANNASFYLHDKPVCDFTGKKCYEIFYDRSTPCEHCVMEQARQNAPKPVLFEDGKRTVSLEAQERHWNGKDVIIIYGRDVSEQASAQRMQAELLDRVPGGVCLYRYDGKRVEPLLVSEAVNELLGVDGFALMQQAEGLLWPIVHPEDAPGLAHYLKTHLTAPGSNYHYQYRIWNQKRQRYLWIEFHANVVRQNQHLLVYVTYTDVTDASQARKSLENSRYALNMLTQYGNLAIWSYDLDDRRVVQEYSDYGAYGSELVEENVPDSYVEKGSIHPGDADRYRACYQALLDGGEKSDCVVRVWDWDCRCYQWMHIFLIRQKDLQDGHRRALCFSVVVDQEVKSIRKLEQTQAELENVVQEMTAAQDQLRRNQALMEARLNLERKRLQNNDQRLLFYYVANLTRETVVEYKAHDDAAPVLPEGLTLLDMTRQGERRLAFAEDKAKLTALHRRETLLENYQQGVMQKEYKTQIVNRQGQILWTSHRMQLLQDPASGDVLLYEYVYNIDTEQVVESMLKMEMSYGYEVIGNLFVQEDQFTFLDIEQKRGTPQLRVVKFADYVQSYAEAYMHPEDRARYLGHYAELPQIAADPDCEHSEVLYRTFASDGSVRYHKDDNYFYDKVKGIFLLTRREYTDVVRAEEEEKRRLTDALAQAEEAGKAKNDFLARMSHDMRTPMNAIIGLTALTVDAADDPDEVKNNMAKLNSAGDYLLGLVNDILDMAKIEERTLSLKLEPYRYSDFLLNMRTTFLPQCEAKGIALYIAPHTKNPVALCDKTRVNQIFYNILSNAVKYTPAGGRIEYRVHGLEMQDGKLRVEMIVQDNGIGMTEEFQKQMFEPFAREDTAVTAELQGSGLGLSITKQLVELMGGSIHIDSAKGRGTTVTVRFVFECLNEDEREETRWPTPPSDLSLLRGKVALLVEDHPLNAEIARKVLEKQGMTVLWAENGRIGVERFRASAPGSIDVILMDIRMPEMDGLEATRAIRALAHPDAATVPIVAMSANAYPEDVQKSLEAGMNAHLSKPIHVEGLLRTLIQFLSK